MRPKRRPPEAGFQMAPMIDMVFLLLVFFMTVSTLARDSRPETDLPRSAVATVPSETPPRDVLTVLPDETDYRLFWHNRRIDGADLASLIDETGPGLILRAPPGLEWRAWKEVLQVLRKAGLTDIVFATFED